jgi:hypothetical protein
MSGLRKDPGHVSITVPLGTERHGISYACPSCQHCISVEMDPIGVRAEIVSQVVEQLKKR